MAPEVSNLGPRCTSTFTTHVCDMNRGRDDPKVMLLVTFVDLAKKKICDRRTPPHGQTDVIVEIVM